MTVRSKLVAALLAGFTIGVLVCAVAVMSVALVRPHPQPVIVQSGQSSSCDTDYFTTCP